MPQCPPKKKRPAHFNLVASGWADSLASSNNRWVDGQNRWNQQFESPLSGTAGKAFLSGFVITGDSQTFNIPPSSGVRHTRFHLRNNKTFFETLRLKGNLSNWQFL